MLKKLMITTAISGLMIGAAMAEGTSSPPSSSPPSAAPPATQAQPSTPDTSAPAKSDEMKPSPTPSATPSAAPAPAPSGSAQFINSQKPDQYLASKFKGTDVVGSDNEKIGDVSDILFDKSGKIEAYVVSVGGFLGMGSKNVALAPASFQVVPGDKSKNESDKLKLTMTKDQLKQAANFEAYQAPRATTGTGTPSPRPMSPPPSGAPK